MQEAECYCACWDPEESCWLAQRIKTWFRFRSIRNDKSATNGAIRGQISQINTKTCFRNPTTACGASRGEKIFAAASGVHLAAKNLRVKILLQPFLATYQPQMYSH
jgi:hypothetical protein